MTTRIRELLEKNGYEVVHMVVLPDDREMLAAEMARIADEGVAELLLTTGDKTYVIAEKVGYPEQNYFSYVFKKKFGVSPTKYRGQAQGC